MKKVFNLLAKTFMLVVWAVFITNLIQPFPDVAYIALNAMAIFMLLMHGLQSSLFSSALGEEISLTHWEKVSIILFGTFSLLDLKNKYLK